MDSIIITDDMKDIPLILLPEVELVVVRRPPVAGLDEIIEAFDVETLDKKKLSSRGGIYIDGNRLFLSERDAQTHDTLAAVWQERKSLRHAFHKALGTKIDMSHLFIQPAIREESRDYTFHRDYATGWSSEKKHHENAVVFMTVAHKGFGSEAIPGEDAGRPTPFVKDHRASFYHPKTLSNLFQGAANDILVMKAGRDGTVHRAPHQGKGLRWWTFYSAGSRGDIRKKLGMKR